MIIKNYMDNTLNHNLSLVEQKKLQWAQEREEMAKLEQYSNNAKKFEKTNIRTQFMADSEMIQKKFQQQNFNLNSTRRIRSPSLPPIDRQIFRQGSNNSEKSSSYKSNGGISTSKSTQKLSNESTTTGNDVDHFEFNRFDKKTLDSDKISNFQGTNNFNDIKPSTASSTSTTDYTSTLDPEMDYANISKSCGTPSSTSSIASHDIFSVSSSYANSSNLDANNYKGKEGNGRAKWGSFMYDSYSRDGGGRSSRNNGPVWLEKSLSENRESDEETMSISVRSVASFLRGQNVPVDPFIMAERESKRRKAMELQEAIKEQLKERELLKKIEREKRLQEEKIEEERLKKQVELEKERLELEKQLQMEKQENERRKQETMKLALEKAENDAKILREQKKRERMLAQANLNDIISVETNGEETEIFMDGCQKKENEVSDKMSKLSVNSQSTGKEDIDDGETVLIGTPIKLKKKNLDSYRKKTYKKQQNFERESSDDEMSTTKSIDSIAMSALSTTSTTATTTSESSTSSSSTSNISSIKPASVKEPPQSQGQKMLADLDGIALILQTMTPLVPLAALNHDLFGLNTLNLGSLQLAYLQQLQQQQSRMNTPIIIPQLPAKPMIPALAIPDNLNQIKSINEAPNVPEKPIELARDESRDTGFESEGKTSPASSIGGDKDSLSSYDSPSRIKAKFLKTLEQSGVTGLDERNFVIGRQEAFARPQQMEILKTPEVFSGKGRHDTYAVLGKQGTFLIPPERQDHFAITRKQDVISEIPEGSLLPEKREYMQRPQTNPNPPRNMESFEMKRPQTTMVPEKPLTPTMPQIPHDGTFTKDDVKKHDAATSTWDNLSVEKNQVKVLTPQKYRRSRAVRENSETIGTQTESFMFCEFCCFHHHCHHTTMNDTETTTSTLHCISTKTENNTTTTTNQEIKTTTMVRSKSKDNKDKNRLDDRPQWGVNKPSIQYVKASERDPFYVKNRKKRHAKKQEDKYEQDSSICSHKDCPILTVSTNSPVLSRKFCKSRNICTEILPIKTDRNGRVYLLHEENTNNYLINEALKRHHQQQLKNNKSLDYDDKFYSLPKNGKDFQNIFGD